jgi:hypothetical protein
MARMPVRNAADNVDEGFKDALLIVAGAGR